MKKLLFILTALIIMSCSSDDDSIQIPLPQPSDKTWTFYYKDACEDTTSSGNFCVNKDEYDAAYENRTVIDTNCFTIDIENEQGNVETYIWFGAGNFCQ